MEQETIRELLVREEKARKQVIAPRLSGIGLTPGQGHAGILTQLLRGDHVTQRELADRCRLDTATMSRGIDRLSELGFLTRESNPAGRRSFLICLTDKGREKAREAAGVFEWFEKMAAEEIPAQELAVFIRVLRQVCGHLEEYRDTQEQ